MGLHRVLPPGILFVDSADVLAGDLRAEASFFGSFLLVRPAAPLDATK